MFWATLTGILMGTPLALIAFISLTGNSLDVAKVFIPIVFVFGLFYLHGIKHDSSNLIQFIHALTITTLVGVAAAHELPIILGKI